MKKLKIFEGLVVNSQKVERKQIVVDCLSQLILQVGDLKIPREKIDYYFDDDHLIFPAMGDVHVHAREDVSQKDCYKEDFVSVSRAAMNGGVYHICDMPNNPIPPIDLKSYLQKCKIILEKGLIPILPYAGIGPNTRPIKELKVPYKVYMGPSIGQLYFKNRQELEDVIQHYEGEFVSFHCEDPETLENNKQALNHFERRPVEAEIYATDFALYLIEKYSLKGKLCHYSSGEGLQKILNAKARGVNVQCEVTPQHLFFTEEKIKKMDLNQQMTFQMNPPIRSEKDRQKLLTAFREGQIDYLATDHAPHTHEEKLRGTSGLTGLDTFGLFGSYLIREEKISPQMIAKTCCENPGKFFNTFLDKRLGFILPHYRGVFTVMNFKKPFKLEENFLQTKVKHSPFLGMTFPASIELFT